MRAGLPHRIEVEQNDVEVKNGAHIFLPRVAVFDKFGIECCEVPFFKIDMFSQPEQQQGAAKLVAIFKVRLGLPLSTRGSQCPQLRMHSCGHFTCV